MDIWLWICELPITQEWDESPSQLVIPLATSKPSRHSSSSTQSIQSLTFSVCLSGFEAADAEKIIWVSDACPLSSSQPSLPLILQLVQEIVTRSPTAHSSTCPHSELQNVKPDPVSWILDYHSPESFSGFFNFIFLTRFFWLCVLDAPSAVGSFYFHSLLAAD